VRRLLAGATGLLAAGALAGCQSTQDKSAALAKAAGKDAPTEQNLTIETAAKDVEVRAKDVVTDANGTAVAVVLRNTADTAKSDVPILIDVRDAKGTSIFRNDAAGQGKSLVSVPLLPPRKEVLWVHDQIAAQGGAEVEVKVGEGQPAPPRPPVIRIGTRKLEQDATTGTVLNGALTNRSKVDQRELTVFAVARQGRKLVAAGRAVVPEAPAGEPADFSIFFIGDPTRGDLELQAPPSVLK
jgi:hypothetical protein